jgi:hypothetical protein
MGKLIIEEEPQILTFPSLSLLLMVLLFQTLDCRKKNSDFLLKSIMIAWLSGWMVSNKDSHLSFVFIFIGFITTICHISPEKNTCT